MGKVLNYILVGVGSAVAASAGTYFITKKIVSGKCKDKYEAAMALQLNECRNYYRAKLLQVNTDLQAPKEVEYDSKEEAQKDNDVDDIVVTDTSKKTASEIMQEKEVVSYHKMYGEPKLEDLWSDDDDEDEDPLDDEPKGPYLIKQAEYYREEGYDCANMTDEFILFTGDFTKTADGEKEYIQVLYSPGEDRVVKSAEAAMLLGQEWRNRFGDDTFDPETGDGYDYEADKVCVRNNSVHTDYCIIRDDRMYKCAILGLEPGDPFDYDTVR